MKKLFCFVIIILQLSIFTSCSTTTITDEPGNYNYGINEEINIVDIDTRETLGTVKITGFEILKDEPFVVQEYDGVGENSQTIYKNVTYNQIVQVYYVYTTADSSKTISAANFTISDNKNELTTLNPETDFVEVPREGESSFVIAVKNKSDFLNIDFNYNILQMKPTAKIKIYLSDQVIPEENSSENEDITSSEETSPNSDQPQNDSSAQNEAETSSEEYSSITETSASSQDQSNFELSNYLKYNHLFIIAVILLAVVIILLILLIVFARRK